MLGVTNFRVPSAETRMPYNSFSLAEVVTYLAVVYVLFPGADSKLLLIELHNNKSSH